MLLFFILWQSGLTDSSQWHWLNHVINPNHHIYKRRDFYWINKFTFSYVCVCFCVCPCMRSCVIVKSHTRIEDATKCNSSACHKIYHTCFQGEEHPAVIFSTKRLHKLAPALFSTNCRCYRLIDLWSGSIHRGFWYAHKHWLTSILIWNLSDLYKTISIYQSMASTVW